MSPALSASVGARRQGDWLYATQKILLAKNFEAEKHGFGTECVDRRYRDGNSMKEIALHRRESERELCVKPVRRDGD